MATHKPLRFSAVEFFGMHFATHDEDGTHYHLRYGGCPPKTLDVSACLNRFANLGYYCFFLNEEIVETSSYFNNFSNALHENNEWSEPRSISPNKAFVFVAFGFAQ